MNAVSKPKSLESASHSIWKKKFFPLAALPGSKGKTSASVGLAEDLEELQKLASAYQKVLLRKRLILCENFWS